MSDARADRVAAELRRRGLAAPAMFLLDAHRPMAPLVADAAAVVAPFASAILGGAGLAGTARELLAQPDGADLLLASLAADDDRGGERCRTSET